MIHNHSQQIFSAEFLSRFSQQIFSADLLSRFSQQIFAADLRSRFSPQIFSADFLRRSSQQIFSADFLSRSSQQIFSADFLSRSSQSIFSADFLSRSSQQIFSFVLSFAVVRGWWSAIVSSFAVVRGWWSYHSYHLLWSGVGGQLLSYHVGGLYCTSSLEGPFRGAFGKSKRMQRHCNLMSNLVFDAILQFLRRCPCAPIPAIMCQSQ